MTAARPIFYDDLLPSEQRLVAAMQRFKFGRFARLGIHRGEAVLSPWPVTVRGIKFGDNLANQVQCFGEGTRLPQQVSELLAYIRSISGGEILSLEFRHALPFRMEIETRGESDGNLQDGVGAQRMADQMINRQHISRRERR